MIGEIKPSSPHLKKVATSDFVTQASIYEKSGVAAISVLTDKHHFGGSFELLRQVRERVKVQLLMKDFVIDEAQVVEGLRAGADAVLLIVDMLEPRKLRELIVFAEQLGLVALVEIQDELELETALQAGTKIIGVNSRNLRTLEINEQRALRVVSKAAQHLPTLYLSGIKERSDVQAAQRAGAVGVLVGSSLMLSTDVVQTILELKGIA